MKNLNDIVKADLCLGCGLCNLNTDPMEEKVELKYSFLKGHVVPKKSKKKSKNFQIGFDLCPGKGYKIDSLAKEYGCEDKYHRDLGYYDDLKVVTSKDNDVSEYATSSGVTTLIAKLMIEEKIVDKVIVSKYKYTEKGPVAYAFSTDSDEEIKEAQGSKYCPVNFAELISELKEGNAEFSYAFVGLPCQIASLKYIQSKIKNLGIKYYIGTFCGGFKSYNNMKQLFKLYNFNSSEIHNFRFRIGRQPGKMLIQDKTKSVKIPLEEYTKMTGYLKLKRCHLCVDATAELADFSCGDAWLPKFLKTKISTSIVITRNKEATRILNKLVNTNKITSQKISEEEIIESQSGNIKSKKYRQKSRLKLYKMLGVKTPEIEEGFRKDIKTSLLLEMNIFIRHRIKLFFEKIDLYYLFYYKKTSVQRYILNLWEKVK
jgi:coenzyme F420 hydrogenase subunit beta